MLHTDNKTETDLNKCNNWNKDTRRENTNKRETKHTHTQIKRDVKETQETESKRDTCTKPERDRKTVCTALDRQAIVPSA